jgi:hypothetical protein
LHTLVEDEAYFDAAYATLAAWGMHRLGPGNTKLLDLAAIEFSVREHAVLLEHLAALNIAAIAQEQHTAVVGDVWAVVAGLKVSVAKARVVANSKLLRHILPERVPPMDREYTFRFFYGRAMLSVGEESASREIFLRLLRIGHDHLTSGVCQDAHRLVGKAERRLDSSGTATERGHAIPGTTSTSRIPSTVRRSSINLRGSLSLCAASYTITMMCLYALPARK